LDVEWLDLCAWYCDVVLVCDADGDWWVWELVAAVVVWFE